MLEKEKQLFEYLLAINNLRYEPIRSYREYDEHWMDELFEELDEGCYLFGTGKDKETVLEIHRQEITQEELIPPAPDKKIKEWITYNYENENTTLKIPESKAVRVGGAASEEERFESDSNRVRLFHQWKEDWEDWAESVRLKKKVQKLYEEFFKLIQIFQKEGEGLEFLLGRWMLTWDHPNKEVGKIHHPLFTAKLDIDFDSESGVIFVKSGYQGYRLELDALSGLSIPNIQDINRLGQEVRYLDLLKDSVDEYASRFMQLVDAKGRLNKEGELLSFHEEPVAFDRFLFILRRKDNHVLKKDLESIIDLLNDEELDSSPAITSLVGRDVKSNEELDSKGWDGVGDELYFPLPANEEQKEIIRRIAQNYGVTVQGPPGTGKTHTIANIVSHLLAHGKKILITSQKENPLKVLKNKIPKDIQDLCVPVLGGGRDSLNEIEKSIRTISENLGSLSVETLQSEVNKAKEELDKSRRKEATLKNQLMDYTQKEKEEMTYQGQTIDKTMVAKILKENTVDLSWIKDNVSISKVFPLKEEEFLRLWTLKQKLLPTELQLKTTWLPSSNLIKPTVEMGEWLRRGKELKEARDGVIDKVNNLSIPLDEEYLQSLLDIIDKILPHELFLQDGSPFKFVVDDCFNGGARKERWVSFIENTKQMVKDIIEFNQKVLSFDIQLSSQNLHELESHVQLLETRLKQGKKLNFMFFLTQGKKAKYLCEQSIINGKPILTLQDVEVLQYFIALQKKKKELVRTWNANVTEIGATEITGEEKRLTSELDNMMKQYEQAFQVAETIYLFKEKVQTLSLPIQDWLSIEAYQGAGETIKNAVVVMQYDKWVLEYENYVRELKDAVKQEHAHPVMGQLLLALQEKDESKWKEYSSFLTELVQTKEMVLEFYNLLEKVNASTPLTATWLEETVSSKTDYPKEFEKAWELKGLESWMLESESFDAEAVEKNIQNEQQY